MTNTFTIVICLLIVLPTVGLILRTLVAGRRGKRIDVRTGRIYDPPPDSH